MSVRLEIFSRSLHPAHHGALFFLTLCRVVLGSAIFHGSILVNYITDIADKICRISSNTMSTAEGIRASQNSLLVCLSSLSSAVLRSIEMLFEQLSLILPTCFSVSVISRFDILGQFRRPTFPSPSETARSLLWSARCTASVPSAADPYTLLTLSRSSA